MCHMIWILQICATFPGDYRYVSHNLEITDMCHMTWSFRWVLRIQTQVFMFIQLAFSHYLNQKFWYSVFIQNAGSWSHTMSHDSFKDVLQILCCLEFNIKAENLWLWSYHGYRKRHNIGVRGAEGNSSQLTLKPMVLVQSAPVTDCWVLYLMSTSICPLFFYLSEMLWQRDVLDHTIIF